MKYYVTDLCKETGLTSKPILRYIKKLRVKYYREPGVKGGQGRIVMDKENFDLVINYLKQRDECVKNMVKLDEVAKRYGCSGSTVRRWVIDQHIPNMQLHDHNRGKYITEEWADKFGDYCKSDNSKKLVKREVTASMLWLTKPII